MLAYQARYALVSWFHACFSVLQRGPATPRSKLGLGGREGRRMSWTRPHFVKRSSHGHQTELASRQSKARPEPGRPGPKHITVAIAAVQHEGSRNPVAARAFAGTGKYRLADDTDAICTPHSWFLLR